MRRWYHNIKQPHKKRGCKLCANKELWYKIVLFYIEKKCTISEIGEVHKSRTSCPPTKRKQKLEQTKWKQKTGESQ